MQSVRTIRSRAGIDHPLVIVPPPSLPQSPLSPRSRAARVQLIALGVVGGLMLIGGLGVISCSSSAGSRAASDAPELKPDPALGTRALATDRASPRATKADRAESSAPPALDGAATDLEKLFAQMGSDQGLSAGSTPASRIIARPPPPMTEEEEPVTSPTPTPPPPSLVSSPAQTPLAMPAPPSPLHAEPALPAMEPALSSPSPALVGAPLSLDTILTTTEKAPPRPLAMEEGALKPALPLAAREALGESEAGAQLDAIEVTLSPKQQFALAALRRVHARLQSADAGDAARLSRVFSDEAGALAGIGVVPSAQAVMPEPERGLRLTTAALCTRVESYGRYAPFESTRFLAGRPNPMIVYAELEGFRQSGDEARDKEVKEIKDDKPVLNASPFAPAKPAPEEWGVDLAMELELIAADGLVVWRQPQAIMKDKSRSRRKDLFVVQKIELPAAVSVGSYTLKVRLKDRLATAEAETNIPVEVVADAGLVVPGVPSAPSTTLPAAPTLAPLAPSKPLPHEISVKPVRTPTIARKTK